MSATVASPDAALLQRVAERYAGASRWAQGYVRGKLRRDPSTAAVLSLARQRRFGAVLDLGCGRAQLGIALLESGLACSLHGMDRDAAKIAEARSAAHGLRASFEIADLAQAALPECDTLLIVDLLYLMSEPAQHALLARAVHAARRRLVVRAFDPEAGWRSACGLALESAARLLRGELRAGIIRPLPIASLRATLEAAGFATAAAPCWGTTPLPNTLLIAERGA